MEFLEVESSRLEGFICCHLRGSGTDWFWLVWYSLSTETLNNKISIGQTAVNLTAKYNTLTILRPKLRYKFDVVGRC